MHELGIVFHMIRTVEGVATDRDIARVSAVTLELGEVSGIIPSYLESCWRWACDRSELMRGADLVVEEVPAITYCEDCERTYPTVEHGRTCPYCGSGRTVLAQGDETIIKEIAVPDERPGGLAGSSEVADSDSAIRV
ncbi:hydrogenase expression/synthesis HypA [Coriobacterium glomerans PW2]|uniref:Hydrogenase maturation factor HypA n=1 Tax=Coriobacterium glomerans (strain ATCC 49209 / DSM 20642 / JCM 10262 / PW2) TaxID=700015 RepID=F2NA90_CORGP|nr:hydrogenase maturation nickel metallochaperone HypA [Coriobacterium glomerans]AEB06276.1 hydrogenase expression/synthesis HypA [Coriobacterium glomerans PW2]